MDDGTDICACGDGIEIRRAGDGDIGYVIGCVRRSVEASVEDDERELSDLWIRDILSISETSIREGRMDDEVYVAVHPDGGYAGMVWLGSSRDEFTCDATGYLLGIFVEPELRRKGLGSRLLSFAEGVCREKGYLHMSLNVGYANASARSFYDSHGYGIRSEVRRKGLYRTL
ncbi:MAG: GNAT family N-acetyltransferase [Candidatus Methanomethylophilaceae archaeon]